MEQVKTTLNLPADIFKEAKLAAIHQNITFTEVVIRGLKKTLKLEDLEPKKHSFSSFLRKMSPLPSLTDKERKTRYHQYFEQKYG